MSHDADKPRPEFPHGALFFSPEDIFRLIQDGTAGLPEGLPDDEVVVAEARDQILAIAQAFEGVWDLISDRPVALFLQAPFLQLMATLEHLEILLGDDGDLPEEFLVHRRHLIDFLKFREG